MHIGIACLLWFAPLASGAQQAVHPYTATRITEITRMGSDGTPVHETVTEKLARDSAGRTYTEGTTPGGRRVIHIDDVKAKMAYTLFPYTMTGEQRSYTTGATYAAYFRNDAPGTGFGFQLPPGTAMPKPVVQALGAQRIGGLNATGVRSTLTLPAGTVLNGKKLQAPATVVTDTWTAQGYGAVEESQTSSSDLVPSVSMSWNDIHLAEPDPKLFDTSAYKLAVSAYSPAQMFTEAKAELASLPPGIAADELVQVAQLELDSQARDDAMPDAQQAFQQALMLPSGIYAEAKHRVESGAIIIVLGAPVDNATRTRAAIRMAQQGDIQKSFLYGSILTQFSAMSPQAAAAAGSNPMALATECYQADGSFPYSDAAGMLSRGEWPASTRQVLLRLGYSAAVHNPKVTVEPLQFFQLGHQLDPELDDALTPAIVAVLGRFNSALQSQQKMNLQFAGEYLKLLQQIAPAQAANFSQLAAAVAVKTAGMRPLFSQSFQLPQPDPDAALADALAQPNPEIRFSSLVSLANWLLRSGSDDTVANQAADAALAQSDAALAANRWPDVESAAALARTLAELGRPEQATALTDKCLAFASQQAALLDAHFESQPPQDIPNMRFDGTSANSIVSVFQSVARADFDDAAAHAEALQAPLLKPLLLAEVAYTR